MNNPVTFQRVEGIAIYIAATAIYFNSDFSLLYYLIFLFSFDIFMVGYLKNTSAGATVYNIGHSFTLPSLLVLFYIIKPSDLLLGVACLWFAHIGIDRALGYGLKFSSSFKNTHLGKIAKR